VVEAGDEAELVALPAAGEPPEPEAEAATVAEVAPPVGERETLPLEKERIPR